MKYSYRDEYYYGYLEDRVSIAHIIIWTALGLYADDFLLLRIIFFCLAAVFGIHGYVIATKRYKKAMAFRHKMMKQGYRCTGKVINAGGEKEIIVHEYYDDDGVKRDFNTQMPNYWIEVEYPDCKDGQVKQARVEPFGKKTKALIGRRADVYLHNGSIYIDIP
ncbi:MAG: hypothetical protein Q4G07_05990 [Oscillospiraceae bacterium]|nr:hypothetical protein [Oscillospiraceae bacterium]